MDSARKRKASNATPSSSDGTTTKKIKLLNSNASDAPHSTEEVQRVGNKLMGMLHNAQDKHGRNIADAFVTLPPQDELPDYYEVIQLPIAIDTIEAKLRRDAYPTITTLESDLKRMVQNAKDYNQPKSDVYEDAERIRKLVYNYMKVHNPQYKLDPTYSSFPTPIPKDSPSPVNGGTPSESAAKPTLDKPASSRSSAPRQTAPNVPGSPSERQISAAPSGANHDESAYLDFTGRTFQEAQQIIISELIGYSDEEGLEIFTPFASLPSRKLPDYYRIIQHPVSLRSIQKRTFGQHGRNLTTHVTDFKSWDVFEEEVSYIWRNAREYNEDGSEMFELAGEFEKYFKSLLADAKEKIEEPSGTRIKINAPRPKSGITLNLSQHRNSPTPGVTVDNEALARQRQMVQAGVNGRQTEQPAGTTANGASSSTPQAVAAEASRPLSSATPAAASPSIMVKDERTSTQSPAPNGAMGTQTATTAIAGTMAPPVGRPLSGSPYPTPPVSSAVNSFHYTAPALLPPTAVRSYPISQALLPVVTISTHPQLAVATPFSIAVPPHVALSQQSTTITLPSSHYYLQIAPTISKELSMGRAYKMFVTINGARMTQRDTHFHADSGKRTHVYEGSLVSGVNRIEVEVVAAKPESNGSGKGSLEVEKVTVFANLMRP